MIKHLQQLNTKPYTILVVDDTPTNLKVIVDYLYGVGFRILLARNGESGIKRALHGLPDLILLDVLMPGMDGFETCRRLKANEQTENIPVIFMTALADIEYKVHGFEVGAVDYVTKPIQQQELLARISAHLQIRDLTLQLEQMIVGLEQEQARLEQIVSSIPGSVVITDRVAPHDIWWANEAFDTIAQAVETHVWNCPVLQFFMDSVEKERVRQQLLTENRVQEFVTKLQYGEGKPFWGRVSINQMEYMGKPALLWILENVDDIKQAEETLRYLQKRENLDALAGGIAHELRNPLGVIANAVYFLEMTLPEPGETTKEYLTIIKTLVRESEKIVSDLLSLSPSRSVNREMVKISEIVREALSRFKIPSYIEVVMQIPKDLPLICVDCGQAAQAILNLMTNACQAMPSGGRLLLTAYSNQTAVSLTIQDEGVGIPSQNLERIFEPLFTTKAKGIGLGLAIAKGLVEVNDGQIVAESQEGDGSQFTIIFSAVS